MRRSVWPVLAAAIFGTAVLVSLGVWQMQRLHWKEALIAAVDRSIAGPALTLDEARKRSSLDHAKVKLRGEFEPGPYVLVIATFKGGPAWNVLRPLRLEDGTVILVECGKSLSEEPPAPPEGLIATEAIVRLHPGRKGMFEAENTKGAKVYYWWDVPGMAHQLGATESGFTVALLPGMPGTEGLQVEPPRAALRNNHLGYAMTWFGLAGVLVVMAALFLRSRIKEG